MSYQQHFLGYSKSVFIHIDVIIIVIIRREEIFQYSWGCAGMEHPEL
jgi:hypothetical protein